MLSQNAQGCGTRQVGHSEIVNDIIDKRLLVACTTRWNSFYDAVAWISEIPVAKLNTISSQLQLKWKSEREHQVLKEYRVSMKPLNVALDILQGEDNCFYGTLWRRWCLKHLAILDGLPEAIVQVRAAILFCIYIYPINSSFAFVCV